MEAGHGGRIYGRYVMGSRVSLMARDVVMGSMAMGGDVPSPVIVARAGDATEDCPDPNFCKKPFSTSQLAVPIALGVM